MEYERWSKVPYLRYKSVYTQATYLTQISLIRHIGTSCINPTTYFKNKKLPDACGGPFGPFFPVSTNFWHLALPGSDQPQESLVAA